MTLVICQGLTTPHTHSSPPAGSLAPGTQQQLCSRTSGSILPIFPLTRTHGRQISGTGHLTGPKIMLWEEESGATRAGVCREGGEAEFGGGTPPALFSVWGKEWASRQEKGKDTLSQVG